MIDRSIYSNLNFCLIFKINSVYIICIKLFINGCECVNLNVELNSLGP